MQTATTPPTTQPATPFKLVDDFMAKWFRDRFKRVPKTLFELESFREQMRYENRMAELKAMAPKLALLDPLLPEIAAHGVELARLDFNKRHVEGIGVVVSIMPRWISEGDGKLYAALLAVGFKEIERKRIGSSDKVTLKHGRALHVVIEVLPATQSPTEQPIIEAIDSGQGAGTPAQLVRIP